MERDFHARDPHRGLDGEEAVHPAVGKLDPLLAIDPAARTDFDARVLDDEGRPRAAPQALDARP